MAARQDSARLDAHTVARWAIVVPVSVLLGWLFSLWHVPAAWILAAIISSGAMALITGEDLQVNRTFYNMSRGFIGMMAALPLTVVPLGQLVGFLPAAVTNPLSPSWSASSAACCCTARSRAMCPPKPAFYPCCRVVPR